MNHLDKPDRVAMSTNRANWDSRVPVHTAPDGYRLERLIEDPEALSDVVTFERGYLGDLSGLDLIHLQSHLGTDTVSLARLGANVTGLDFSEPAVAAATDLARRCGIEASFVVGDLHQAPAILGQTYDMVYTGVGAINWLPDIRAWAAVVAELLRPGGRFHMTEGHPGVMIYSDDATADHMLIEYPYFEGQPAMEFESETSYAGSGTVASPRSYEWAHNLGAIIQALIDAGLIIDRFDEHQELAWPFLPWMETVPGRDGWYRFPAGLRNSVPLMFTLQARKRR